MSGVRSSIVGTAKSTWNVIEVLVTSAGGPVPFRTQIGEEAVEARTYKGRQAKVLLYDDRVEIKRSRIPRIGQPEDFVVALVDIVQPLGKRPTWLLNGWVYLATDADPAHLAYWADPPKLRIGVERQAIVFNLGQRKAYEDFLAALTEALRSVRSAG